MLPPSLQIMRPQQWIKNAFVLAPMLFSFRFDEGRSWVMALTATLGFCLLASAVYIFNDIGDREEDRQHPEKSKRPLATGAISLKSAWLEMWALLLLTAGIAYFLPLECGLVFGLYFLSNIAYSRGLKHKAILDVIIIALGFVWRILVGSYAVDAPASPWILVSTFLLALFLATGKRRHEFLIEPYKKARRSLEGYSEDLLDKMIGISCASALISYVFYTVEVGQETGNSELIATVPFVVFGLFRYLRVIYYNKDGGKPEKVLFHDKLFLGNIVLWLVISLWILRD